METATYTVNRTDPGDSASELAAKADSAITNATSGGASAPTAGDADKFFRDLGVLTYLEATARPVDGTEHARVMATLRDLDERGALRSFDLHTTPPPAPGAAGMAPPSPPVGSRQHTGSRGDGRGTAGRRAAPRRAAPAAVLGVGTGPSRDAGPLPDHRSRRRRPTPSSPPRSMTCARAQAARRHAGEIPGDRRLPTRARRTGNGTRTTQAWTSSMPSPKVVSRSPSRRAR